MAQILGLDATGKLIVSLAPSADTGDVMADAVVAQLRRSVDLLSSASQRRQRVAARDAVKEILRVAQIYDEILAGSDAAREEPAPESASTGSQRLILVRYAPAGFEESVRAETDHCATEARHTDEGREDALEGLDSDFTNSSVPELDTIDKQDIAQPVARFRVQQGITQHPTPPPSMSGRLTRTRESTTPTRSSHEDQTGAVFVPGEEQGGGDETWEQRSFFTEAKEVAGSETGMTQGSTSDSKDQMAGPGKQQEMQHPPICMETITLAPISGAPAGEGEASLSMVNGTHPSGWYSQEAETKTPSRALSVEPANPSKPDEPEPTGRYATTSELAVWVWVPPERRLHVWEYDTTSARSARLSLKDGQEPLCTEARTNELSHIYLEFACGKNKDDFLHNARELVKTGHQIATEVYQIIIDIATPVAYEYFKRSLASVPGKRDIVRQIVAENKPHNSSEGDGFRILDIKWSGKTKNGKKRGKDNPILGTVVLTLTSHVTANHMLLNKLRLHGLSHAVRIYAPATPLLQCLRCGKLGHHRAMCKERMLRCLKCASEDHTQDQCVPGTTPRCILCEEKHITVAFDCKVKHRVRRVAERKLPPFAHCSQQTASKPMLLLNRSHLH
ncbi:protein AIR1/2 [Microdochium nivale]|nr:protein AIR1/2 [Microdochium nivale]